MATDSTRAAILQAARQVLFDEGWKALSHQRVAAVAGVGRATVYRHWPDRVQLLQDACSLEVLVMHAELTGDLRTDLLAELEAARRELAERRAGRVLIALTDRAVWEPELAEVKRRLVDDGLSALRLILERGVKGGQLDRRLDIDGALATLAGSLVYRQVFLEQHVTKRMVERVVDDFLARYGR